MRTSSIPFRHKVFFSFLSLFGLRRASTAPIAAPHFPSPRVPICDLKIVLIAKASEERETFRPGGRLAGSFSVGNGQTEGRSTWPLCKLQLRFS
jgi:hypothetical protein